MRLDLATPKRQHLLRTHQLVVTSGLTPPTRASRHGKLRERECDVCGTVSSTVRRLHERGTLRVCNACSHDPTVF